MLQAIKLPALTLPAINVPALKLPALKVLPVEVPPENREERRSSGTGRIGDRRKLRPGEMNLTARDIRKRYARGFPVSADALDLCGIRPRRSPSGTTRASVTRTGRVSTRRRTAAFRSASTASSTSGDDGGGEPPPPCSQVALASAQVAAAGFVPEGVES